jgi:ABC-type multidrug transport system fused ATPase/permease subunit
MLRFFQNPIFRKSDKTKMAFLVLAIFLSVSLEALGIAGIFPVMKILLAEDGNASNSFIWFGINILDYKEIILLAYLIIFLIAAFTKLGMLYLQNRVVYDFEAELSSRVLQRYLFGNYDLSREASSSYVSKMAISEVNAIIQNYVLPVVNLLSNTVLVGLIVIALLMADFWSTLVILITLAFIYIGIVLIAKAKISVLSQLRTLTNEKRFQIVGDAIDNLKTIKVFGVEKSQASAFASHAEKYADTTVKASFINAGPKIVVETLIFLMLFIVVGVFLDGDELISVIPLLTLYVLAATRLLPAAQKIYSSVSHLRYSEALLAQFDSSFGEDISLIRSNHLETSSLKFEKSLRVENLSYIYPGSENGIHDITFTIKKGETIAIVGENGSGKSTLLDSLLCLNQTQSGQIFIDQIAIDKKQVKEFLNLVGYVPQTIGFFQDTIQFNITMDSSDIEDTSKIWAVLDAVGLREIVEKFPNLLLEELTGNDCVLSGGELQRLVIARALYFDPSILVFDEATSALDDKTSLCIDKILQNPEYTVINITHKINDLSIYDHVLELRNGRLL